MGRECAIPTPRDAQGPCCLDQGGLSRAESLEGYSPTEPPAQTAPRPPQTRSISLSAAISDFKAEHGPQWSQEMRNKADAYLALLAEFCGPDKGMDQITRQDAAEMKQVVLTMPVNRKTKAETRDLTLREAVAVPGLPTLSTKTANSYLDMFRRFWDWAGLMYQTHQAGVSDD